MKFRTSLQIPSSGFRISHTNSLLSLGSCFAERIGEKLRLNKFNTLINPCGILYNPLSLTRFLNSSLQSAPDPRHFVQTPAGWASYDFHSSITAPSHRELEQKLIDILDHTKQWLASPGYLILTLGTSVVYRLRETGQLTGNCHKMPASLFEKELLQPEAICRELLNTFALLRQHNTGLKILLTVSPVRHVKDTLQIDSVSKSILRLVCHLLEQELDYVTYFPSYEIMKDDLRDYRFYKDDLIHPSAFAEEYIWQEFQKTFFDSDTQALLEEWIRMVRRLEHKPFHNTSAGHKSFMQETLSLLEQLNHRIDCSEEIRRLQKDIEETRK